MFDSRGIQLLAARKNLVARMDVRARAASRSKWAPYVLGYLLVHAGDNPPELDGHVAFVERKAIFVALCLVNKRISRNGLHKLLHRLAVEGLVELKGRKVRLSRAFADDLCKAAAADN